MSAIPSRTSSIASNRPRRSRSLSTLQSRPLSQNESFREDTYQQALTAAEIAFGRAQKRTLLGRTPQQEAGTTLPVSKPQLSRMQSIRFAGPNALKAGDVAITCREVPAYHAKSVARNESYQIIQQRLSSEAENHLPVLEEYVEDNIASQPSSYRKLRKARSMFAPGKAIPSTSLPQPRRHFNRRSVRSSSSFDGSVGASSRPLHRSFSFLRGAPEHLSTRNSHCSDNDAVIRIARDEFLKQIEQQRVKDQNIFSRITRKHRAHRPFRRTVRTSCVNEYGQAVQSPLLMNETANPQGFGGRTRIASQTMKRMVKKFFGKPMVQEGHVPVQHLPASKPHYGDTKLSETPEYTYPPIPSPDVGLLRRVESHESIRRSPSGSLRNENPAGSLKCVPSIEEMSQQGSRVTSWTDSTAANTLNLIPYAERKRLSVIVEDGAPYQPSFYAINNGEQDTAYAAFRQPANIQHPNPVVAQRVFSALQKEMLNSRLRGRLEKQDIDENDAFESDTQIRYGSVRRVSSHHSAENVLFDRAHIDQESRDDDAYSDVDVLLQTEQVTYDSGRGHLQSMTLQEIAQVNEANSPPLKQPFQEIGNGFFPNDFRIEKASVSPYRQATRVSVGENVSNDVVSNDFPNHVSHNSPSEDDGNPIRRSSTAISESVYSCTSGGHSLPNTSSSLSITEKSRGRNTNVGVNALEDGNSQDDQLKTHSDPSSRQPSNDSSVEWKKWMASEVSYIQDNGIVEDGIYNVLPLIRSGHKRESAQIDEDDVEIGNPQKTQNLSGLPLGLTESNTRSHLSNRNWNPAHQPETLRFAGLSEVSTNVIGQQKERQSSKSSPFGREPKSGVKSRLDPVGKHDENSNILTEVTLYHQKENDTVALSPGQQRLERLQRLRNKSLPSLNVIHRQESEEKSPDRNFHEQGPISNQPPSHSTIPSDFRRATSSTPSPLHRGKIPADSYSTHRPFRPRITDKRSGNEAFL